MSDPKYNFQYCQKLIIFDESGEKVLLAKRAGEADYDGTFTFIGGKMETTDASIVAALQREKDEEIGAAARVRVYLAASNNVLFRKKDGNTMIVPHYGAQFIGGEITLNAAEYSAFAWVPLNELAAFEPKVDNIPELTTWAAKMLAGQASSEPTEI